MHRTLLLVPVVALLLAGQAKEDDAVTKDKAALRGTWQLVSLVTANGDRFEGDKVPPDAFYVITEDKMATKLGDKTLSEMSYTINPAKDPKELDYMHLAGPNKGKLLKGIYKVEGDTLTMCNANGGGARPKEFKASKELDNAVQTYKRVK